MLPYIRGIMDAHRPSNDAMGGSDPRQSKSKRRLRRTPPRVKVSRQRLDNDGDRGSYVEFLHFVRSPPGTTLDDVRKALSEKSREPRERTNLDDISSQLMAGLTVESSADKADARENFERIMESKYEDDDEIPNLDELSCCNSAIASDRGAPMLAGFHPSGNPALASKTSPADVLAWTALGMLMGNGKSSASLAPFSSTTKGASVFEDDEASMPSVEGAPEETADEAGTAALSADNEGTRRPPTQEVLLPEEEVPPCSTPQAVFVTAPPPESMRKPRGFVYRMKSEARRRLRVTGEGRRS